MRSIKGCYIPQDRAVHFGHRATPEEVQEVVENREWPPLWMTSKRRGESPEYICFGRTAEGRYLFIPGVVFASGDLKGLFMPWTVREMTEREKRSYWRRSH